jgi:hypothetical protein
MQTCSLHAAWQELDVTAVTSEKCFERGIFDVWMISGVDAILEREAKTGTLDWAAT